MSEKNGFFGSVVRSVSGRDRYRVFVVTDVYLKGTTVMLRLVDGSLRRCGSPKEKNARHVEVIGRLTGEEQKMLTDALSDGLVKKLVGKYDPLRQAADGSTNHRPERGGTEN